MTPGVSDAAHGAPGSGVSVHRAAVPSREGSTSVSIGVSDHVRSLHFRLWVAAAKYPALLMMRGFEMAEIVLVHGIAQEHRGADELEAEWIPGLASGLRSAGYGDLADRIWRMGGSQCGFDTRMAFYGDVFRDPDMQGYPPGELEDFSASEAQLASSLAEGWLNAAATRGDHPDHQQAMTELAYVAGGGEVQGLGQAGLRRMVSSLAHLSWFAKPTMAFAESFVLRALRQVTKYMCDPEIQEQVNSRLTAHLDDTTRVVIGHSLGSVVAYQVAVRHLSRTLPLLVTLGSPLGLRTIIYDRLRPQPPCYPPYVGTWINVADRSDLVAAEPDFGGMFTRVGEREGAFSSIAIDNGAQPHKATSYLTSRSVGERVAAALVGRV